MMTPADFKETIFLFCHRIRQGTATLEGLLSILDKTQFDAETNQLIASLEITLSKTDGYIKEVVRILEDAEKSQPDHETYSKANITAAVAEVTDYIRKIKKVLNDAAY